VTIETFPFTIGWELTLACNLSCRHCGSAAGRPRPRELTLDEGLAICDQLPALLVQEVDFTGGEPLLHPGWFALTRRLVELGIDVKLVTNGTLVDARSAERMREAGLSTVGFSVDGTAATHDALRGGDGLHRATVEAIGAARAAGLAVAALTTVSARNVDELPVLRSHLASLGVERWQLQPLFHLGRARCDPGLNLDPAVYRRLGEFLARHAETAPGEMTVEAADSFGYFGPLDRRTPEWGGCPAGRVACGITSDGRVKGCLSLPDRFTEGDLRVRDLWDIWFDPAAFAYTRGWSPAQLGAACRGCARAEQCRGGCSAMSYGWTGAFHADPWCLLAMERDGTTIDRASPAIVIFP
jgi:radical SAM protein with 4Fe4S-binding SPASM domain